MVLSFISVADFQAVGSNAGQIDRDLENRVAMDLQRLLCYLNNIYAMGGWPSGLGSELIIRLRRVQLLHCPFVFKAFDSIEDWIAHPTATCEFGNGWVSYGSYYRREHCNAAPSIITGLTPQA